MSAATMTESATVTKSTIMAESAMTTGKLVSTVKSIMIESVTIIESVTETISNVVWMAPTVCRAVGVRWVSTAVTVSTWIAYVVATLGRNQTNEERQSC